ncbi:hypothetical protein SYYSPA8_13230 [Streptomyces yaizuensis]|uniref:Uncharacterized protein n=1 Tax=Streptomyces yaizuensis TaxID=2989713 RepID=A0ABQ5NY09_9ACTN|nr:hypothetical protein SYYSPA8_13230 [Streptomyces sp. YSPA8]
MGSHVGSHDVRQDDGVAGAGFLTAAAVPVAVAGGGERVNRVDPARAGAQSGDQQAVASLDRDWYRVLGGVAVFGEQLQQHPVAGRVVGDAPLGQLGAGVVGQGDVVVAFGAACS